MRLFSGRFTLQVDDSSLDLPRPSIYSPARFPKAMLQTITARGGAVDVQVICSDCGAELPSGWAHQSTEQPCTRCGSIKRYVNMTIHDNVGVQIHDSVRGKAKDATRPSKANPRLDFFHGDDLRKSDGRWMRKDRVIDKDNDRYMERVVDPTTGSAVHHCEERLSQHVGHGSAKTPKKD